MAISLGSKLQNWLDETQCLCHLSVKSILDLKGIALCTSRLSLVDLRNRWRVVK